MMGYVIESSINPSRGLSEEDIEFLNEFSPSALESYFIPFVRDKTGRTPSHYCIVDGNATDLLLRYLSAYPIGTYTNNIVEIIPFYIMKGIQSIPLYLDARIKQTGFMKKFEREKIKILPEAGFSISGK
jgi:hypothetical protein